VPATHVRDYICMYQNWSKTTTTIPTKR